MFKLGMTCTNELHTTGINIKGQFIRRGIAQIIWSCKNMMRNISDHIDFFLLHTYQRKQTS